MSNQNENTTVSKTFQFSELNKTQISNSSAAYATTTGGATRHAHAVTFQLAEESEWGGETETTPPAARRWGGGGYWLLDRLVKSGAAGCGFPSPLSFESPFLTLRATATSAACKSAGASASRFCGWPGPGARWIWVRDIYGPPCARQLNEAVHYLFASLHFFLIWLYYTSLIWSDDDRWAAGQIRSIFRGCLVWVVMVWVVKFNRYCSSFVLFDNYYLIMN